MKAFRFVKMMENPCFTVEKAENWRDINSNRNENSKSNDSEWKVQIFLRAD